MLSFHVCIIEHIMNENLEREREAADCFVVIVLF